MEPDRNAAAAGSAAGLSEGCCVLCASGKPVNSEFPTAEVILLVVELGMDVP